MKYKIIFSLLLIFSAAAVFSQQLQKNEKQLQSDFLELRNAVSDSLKLNSCKKIEQHLLEALKQKDSFDYPFAGLTKMGKYRSSDNVFRIYNWNCEFADGTYRYFGIVQSKNKKGWKIEVLKDSTEPDMFRQNRAGNWPGAVYYKIIPFKSKRKTMYLLLGWDGNNLSSTKKIIDVLSFDKTGAVVFGMPVIKWRNKMLHRVVFEYAQQAKMNIIYQPKKKRLVFDHLVPMSPQYQNQYDYYAPDFSFDALLLKKGIWQMKENVNPQM